MVSHKQTLGVTARPMHASSEQRILTAFPMKGVVFNGGLRWRAWRTAAPAESWTFPRPGRHPGGARGRNARLGRVHQLRIRPLRRATAANPRRGSCCSAEIVRNSLGVVEAVGRRPRNLLFRGRDDHRRLGSMACESFRSSPGSRSASRLCQPALRCRPGASGKCWSSGS